MSESSQSPSDSSLSPSQVQEYFERLREKVLCKRPILRDILQKKGGAILLDYASQYADVNLNPAIPERQHELLQVIREMVTQRFGEEVAGSVTRQLEQYYFVSTADHDGPISSSFEVNSNLLISAAMVSQSDPLLQNIVVLACTNISLNNFSFPRGLRFNSFATGTLETQRLSFLPSNAHSSPIYNFRAYKKEEVLKIRKSLREKVRGGEVRKREADIIAGLLDEIYDTPELLQAQDFSEQVSKSNFRLWKKFFASSDVKLPNLIYLELEDIVVRLIRDYHLYSDTVVNHILFDPEYEPMILQYFEGIFGSFSRQEGIGTYLFWALPQGGQYVLQLWKEGNFLVSKDGSYRVELTPEALGEAMKRHELIPGLLLCAIVVSFYYGLKCLGGFNQVNYLTLMKNAYLKMNIDLGDYRSIEVCARAQTKEICEGLTIAFLEYGQGLIAPVKGLDLVLYDRPDAWEKVMNVCRQVTLGEAISPLLPAIYRISYEHVELEEELLQLQAEDIVRLVGLDKKTQGCVRIQDEA